MHTVIQLTGSTLADATADADTVCLTLAPGRLLKSQGVAGVDATTLWDQVVRLEFTAAEPPGNWPALPAAVEGGRIRVNSMTYVDMVPVPLESAGLIRLELYVAGAADTVVVQAEEVKLVLAGDAHYLRHLELE